MASFTKYIYIDGVKISDTKFDGRDTFEITSTGLAIKGTQVWTYSGNLIFDGFTQTLKNFPVGTTGYVIDFTTTSGEYIYLNTQTRANYYKASYTDLSSVANAIRNKSGALNKLEFPTGFVSVIEEMPSVGANTAIIDIEVANGTATIVSGEFPDWCNESNSGLIWGSIYINSGFVAGDIDNSADVECMVHNIFTDSETSSIIGFSNNIVLSGSTNGLNFGIMTDLSMIGFITDPESPDGLISMTSGSFEIALIYCDPWSSGTTDEPIELDEPIENNDPAV